MKEKLTSFVDVNGERSRRMKNKFLWAMKRVRDGEYNFGSLLKDYEETLEMTNTDITVIHDINDITNNTLNYYGIDSFDIFHKDIILYKYNDPKRYNSIIHPAYFSEYSQKIKLLRSNFLLLDYKNLIHEIWHFKTNSIAKFNDNNIVKDQYGLVLIQGEYNIYNSFNEALTEELAKESFYQLTFPKTKTFQQEQELLKQEYQKQHGHNINSETFLYCKENERVFSFQFPYQKERQILNILIEKIYQKNKNSFSNPKQVKDYLIKAMLLSDKNAFENLLNNTFGPNTYESLSLYDKIPIDHSTSSLEKARKLKKLEIFIKNL